MINYNFGWKNMVALKKSSLFKLVKTCSRSSLLQFKLGDADHLFKDLLAVLEVATVSAP